MHANFALPFPSPVPKCDMTTAKKKTPDQLRGHRWLGRDDLHAFGVRLGMTEIVRS
jgi:hypothetical protein